MAPPDPPADRPADPAADVSVDDARPPDRLVEVQAGGASLTVGIWGDGPVQVLASHGITANHRSYNAVATALADRGVAVAALDHRGRGGSSAHPGPFGLATHADDLVAVADALDVARPVLVGHSMGGWIVANAGARHGDRLAGLVLIDGGLPVPPAPLPDGVTVADALHATIGPAMARLEMTFDSLDDALDLWREHPAVGPILDAARDYLEWDLVEVDGTWRSRVSRDAVVVDGTGILVDEEATTALARAPMPATLLRAPRDLLDQPPGFLDPAVVEQVCGPLATVTTADVDDVNHYSIVFTDHGIAAIVAAVEAHLP